ncbi:MAG: hypothetical protein AAFV33_29510 [Chloroflexota bacterium]
MLIPLFERRFGLLAHFALFIAGMIYQTWLRIDLFRSGDYIAQTAPFEILRRVGLLWGLILLFHLCTVQLYRAFDTDWRRFAFMRRHLMRDLHIGVYLGASGYLWSLVLGVAMVMGQGLIVGVATVRVLIITSIWGIFVILHQIAVFEMDHRASTQ